MSTTEQVEQVGVMYVGRKPFAVDNVAGSGKTWESRGQVQVVTAAEAAILFNHPGAWWPESDTVPTLEEVDARVSDFYSGNKVPDSIVHTKTPADMTLAELKAHALKEYGAKLKSTSVKAALGELADIAEVDEQQHGTVAAATRITSRATPARGKAASAGKGRAGGKASAGKGRGRR